MNEVVVQKYGGSSVSSTEKIKLIASKLIERKKKDSKIVVVVSAMGDTTDDFINMAKDISKSPDKRELDVLMSTGEMISASLLSMSLNSLGCEAVSYNAYQLNIQTSGIHGKSLIDDIDVSKINESLDSGKIVIVTGFQGLNDEGDITTLGRGGSDTSAVALAVKLQGKCEIYTDVDGIYFTDPRKYPQAKKIKEIEYEEMLELASLGAQVMHSRSVELAQKYGIELYVGLSCSEIEGTYIRGSKKMKLEDKVITGLATCDNDAAITIVDIKIEDVSKLFEKVANDGISIDMISQTAPKSGKVNVSFTIPKDDLNECESIVEHFVCRENIIIDEDITKFSLVGLGMKNTSGVAAKVFKILSDNNIAVKLITTSEIRITCAISSLSKEVATLKEKLNRNSRNTSTIQSPKSEAIIQPTFTERMSYTAMYKTPKKASITIRKRNENRNNITFSYKEPLSSNSMKDVNKFINLRNEERYSLNNNNISNRIRLSKFINEVGTISKREDTEGSKEEKDSAIKTFLKEYDDVINDEIIALEKEEENLREVAKLAEEDDNK